MRPTNRWKFASLAYAGTIVLWIFYAVSTTFGATHGAKTYNLNGTEINIIRLTFLIPILLIWIVATRAAIRFKSYAVIIDESPEAKPFHQISDGLFWLLAYLIGLLVMGRFAVMFAGTSFVYPAVFLKNHVPVVLLLISAIKLYTGSTSLLALTRKNLSEYKTTLLWLGYLTFASLFIAGFYGSGQQPPFTPGIPTFAVSQTTLLFTLIIPSLITWALLIRASMSVAMYTKAVKGRIYKAVLKRLVLGLYTSTVVTILVELLTLNATKLQHVGLTGILLVVYAFLVVYALGSVIISRAARKLTLIEVGE